MCANKIHHSCCNMRCLPPPSQVYSTCNHIEDTYKIILNGAMEVYTCMYLNSVYFIQQKSRLAKQQSPVGLQLWDGLIT